MSSVPMLGGSRPSVPRRGVRGVILSLAFVLACQALWILAAEFLRPSQIGLLDDSETAATKIANRGNARLAALLGYVRGDLWAAYLLTYPYAFELHEKNSSGEQESPNADQIRNIANRALSFAPYESRVWLALANINSRFDWLNGKAAGYLRMSYYTGANEIDLIPLRLSLAVSFADISDAGFQQLVHHDIGIIVTRKPELKQTILNAYSNASSDGKQFIEKTLREMNSTLLSTIQSK